MAIVVTKVNRGPEFFGRRRHLYVTITGDTSYPTCGSVLPSGVGQGALGFRKIENVRIIGGNGASNGRKYQWDKANNKLMAAWSGTASAVFNEVANTTNCSGDTLDAIIEGV